MNIYSLIKNIAEKAPHKLLLSINNEDITCSSFVKETKAISDALLNNGVTPGQKVGMILPNSALWYNLYWSIVKIGALPVPLDPQVGEWEMERLFSITEIEICFIASKYRANNILDQALTLKARMPSLKKLVLVDSPVEQPGTTSLAVFKESVGKIGLKQDFVYEPDQGDRLMLACTSGSTGNPKIISVPHIGFYQSQLDMGKYLELGPADVMLLGMPLYHQGGFGMGLQMVLCGGTVLYQPTFDPLKFLQLIEQYNVTVIQLTATLAKILLSVPTLEQFDLSSLRIAYFAGEVLPMEIAREFSEKRSIRLVNVIGSSETATMVVWDSKYDTGTDVNDFRPLPFTKLKVLDEFRNTVPDDEVGTIYISTDALITDYFKNEHETNLKLITLDGRKWFNTGDLGKKLADGRVRFAGRAKRIIKRGANLIYPEEIESFLLTHPDIKAVAITSVNHELIGEMVVAHIQPCDGCRVTRGDIVKFCRGKLAAYKVPDQVIEIREMPCDIGKIQFKYLAHRAFL